MNRKQKPKHCPPFRQIFNVDGQLATAAGVVVVIAVIAEISQRVPFNFKVDLIYETV